MSTVEYPKEYISSESKVKYPMQSSSSAKNKKIIQQKYPINLYPQQIPIPAPTHVPVPVPVREYVDPIDRIRRIREYFSKSFNQSEEINNQIEKNNKNISNLLKGLQNARNHYCKICENLSV